MEPVKLEDFYVGSLMDDNEVPKEDLYVTCPRCGWEHQLGREADLWILSLAKISTLTRIAQSHIDEGPCEPAYRIAFDAHE